MLTLRRLALAFLVAVLLMGAAAGASACASGNRETWTVCLYLCGSDLETKHARATHTLSELMDADVPANVTVVVQTGGARSWRANGVEAAGTQRFVLRNHGLQQVDAVSAASMGDPDTLASFLEYCASEYPSDRSTVVLWDHGGGPSKGVCFDETAGYDALTLADLSAAFARGRQARGGAPYDIVGMDACLMATLETAVALQDDAGYLVASEEIEPGAGWDYGRMLAALGEPGAGDGGAAARAICDGYRDKCAANGKDASVTLSVIELAEIPRVEQALDRALGAELAAAPSPNAALARLVGAVSGAESFGGTTRQEGVSNLYDLGEIARCRARQADGAADAYRALSDALGAAVAYRVAGAATADATGLSLYFPAKYQKAQLDAYHQATPLSGYVEMLGALYGAGEGRVAFADAGSINGEGDFQVAITADTLDNVYDLYVVNRCVDGESHYETNIDIKDDWEQGVFSHGLDDSALAFGGMALDSQMIEYDKDYVVYSAPISLNGRPTNLRFAEIAEGEEGWRYEVLGTWNGIDHATGLSDRSLDSLSEGDVVGAVSAATERVRDEMTVGPDTGFELEPLSPGVYECWFVVVDLYGNEYQSAVLTYRVTAALEDGESGLSAICEPLAIEVQPA